MFQTLVSVVRHRQGILLNNTISADALTLLNEMFLLLILGGFEAARLYLGQQDNLQKKISVVFRILVLTVPGTTSIIFSDNNSNQ